MAAARVVDASAWARFESAVSSYAHASWMTALLPALPAELNSPGGRRLFDRLLVAQWRLPRLVRDEAETQPAAALCLLPQASLQALLASIAGVTPESHRTGLTDGETARTAAREVAEWGRRLRPGVVFCADPDERDRLHHERASVLLLALAREAWPAALAMRWSLRFPRSLQDACVSVAERFPGETARAALTELQQLMLPTTAPVEVAP